MDPENQSFEKMKNFGNITFLHMSSINDNHMMYGVPEISSMMDIIFCHFGLFFALLSPHFNNPKNQNFEKLKK